METFNTFKETRKNLRTKIESLNEGIFDTLATIFTRITAMFEDPTTLNFQIDQAAEAAGTKDDSIKPVEVKPGSTLIIRLVDKKTPTSKYLLSLTCLVVMPDGSGIYQISATDATEFLTTLGVKNNTELNKVGVLAIIGTEGFVKDKPITMRIYKNIDKLGKPIVTSNFVATTLMADEVAKQSKKVID